MRSSKRASNARSIATPKRTSSLIGRYPRPPALSSTRIVSPNLKAGGGRCPRPRPFTPLPRASQGAPRGAPPAQGSVPAPAVALLFARLPLEIGLLGEALLFLDV